MKEKILKIIVFIVFFILLLIGIDIGRNMFILKKLQNKGSKFSVENNYSIKAYEFQGARKIDYELYKKDDKALLKITNTSNKDKVTITYVKNKNEINTYVDANNEKIVRSNLEDTMPEFINWLYTENIWQLIVSATKSSIHTEICNGKRCYKINEMDWGGTLGDRTEDNAKYIDKETGLIVRKRNGTLEVENEKTDVIVDYHYIFGNVSDEDLNKTDADEYILAE